MKKGHQMFCVMCFPWLMESAKGIFLLSGSSVARPAPRLTALVTYQTMCRCQLERNKCDASMCLMLCLDGRETEFPLCIVKTIILKES